MSTKGNTSLGVGEGSGFMGPQALTVPPVEAAKPIVAQAAAAKVEMTTISVAQGGWAMEVQVPRLSGEALVAQQREQHARALRQAEKLNAAYRARQRAQFTHS